MAKPTAFAAFFAFLTFVVVSLVDTIFVNRNYGLRANKGGQYGYIP